MEDMCPPSLLSWFSFCVAQRGACVTSGVPSSMAESSRLRKRLWKGRRRVFKWFEVRRLHDSSGDAWAFIRYVRRQLSGVRHFPYKKLGEDTLIQCLRQGANRWPKPSCTRMAAEMWRQFEGTPTVDLDRFNVWVTMVFEGIPNWLTLRVTKALHNNLELSPFSERQFSPSLCPLPP